MEFEFTEEQEKLRKEIREFFTNELPADFSPSVVPFSKELQSWYMEFQKKVEGEKGWLTPGWPKELGGLGLGQIEQGIADEETSYWGVGWPGSIGFHISAPAVIMFGTEEQKKMAIPPMIRGDKIWFQCFSEPDAGSDEAHQQTRAVPDGDHFIINGQKTFITGLYKPDYLYTLARTENTVPKHRGISLFLIPADAPGITYRPLPCIAGPTTDEIFFDDVRVHKDLLLGQINRGFYHAMQTFMFERTGTGGPARAKRTLELFVQFCKETKRNGKPLMEDPEVRKAVAEMAVGLELRRLINWYSCWRFGERERIGMAPYNLAGIFNKTLTRKYTEMMTNIIGLYGQLKLGSKWVPLAGQIDRAWAQTRSLHPGGTLEIYKYALAQRGLGLPRIPARLVTEAGKMLKEREAARR